jgi:hypothetical protein
MGAGGLNSGQPEIQVLLYVGVPRDMAKMHKATSRGFSVGVLLGAPHVKQSGPM